MNSKISSALRFEKYHPIGVYRTNDRPANALQFKENCWGCVAAMIVAACKGRTAVFDRDTFGCVGGGVGLGFGNQYVSFPIEALLSTGDGGRYDVQNRRSHLAEGERYFETPDLARRFLDALPMRDVPTEFVAFKPLAEVEMQNPPALVLFLANADQLSALLVLANYHRAKRDNAIAPFGAGCHSILYGFAEEESDSPRAVIGFTDISVRKLVESEILSLTVPWKLFLEMEQNVKGSFLEMDQWQGVLDRRGQNVR